MSPTTALLAFAAFIAVCAAVAAAGFVWARGRRRRAREDEILRVTTLLAHAQDPSELAGPDEGPARDENDGEPTREELAAMLHELRQPRPGLMRRTVTAPARGYTVTASAGQAHGQKLAAWIKSQRDEGQDGTPQP